YGYQLAQKHIYKEGEFDQVDRLLFDLRNNPQSRRIIANMYNHRDLHEMHLYPCAYSLTLNTAGKTLNAILNQRSQDMVVANNWNVVQYSVLVKMLAASCGLVAGELVHIVADAHIYDRHIPVLEELLKRPQYDAPRLVMNEKEDFYSYKVEDFALENYRFSPLGARLPVAI
ncbi:MAG: thymidylate synthase, partial [Clostridia bacterium]|nr:thymidylate synthase [Clostridia bacterium]